MKKYEIMNSLTIKTFIFVFAISLVIITLYTAIEIKLDHDVKVNSIIKSMNDIETTMSESLSRNIWFLENDIIKEQLEGLKRIPGINEAELIVGSDSTTTAKKEISTLNFTDKYIIKKIPLYSRIEESILSNVLLGYLVLKSDLKKIDELNKETFVNLFIKEISQTLLLAVSIYIFFLFFITRPILKISEYYKEIDLYNLDKPILIKRKSKDEISELVHSLNIMKSNLSRSLNEVNAIQDALMQSEERYALIIDATSDGIWDWDLITNTAYFSPRYKNMLGYTEDEIDSGYETWVNLLHPDDLKDALKVLRESQDGTNPAFQIEFRMRCKDGNYKWILSRGKTIFDHTNTAIRMIGSHTDISKNKNFEEELAFYAHTDLLTGVYNRRMGISMLEKHINLTLRHETKLTICFLDVNNLKFVNDTFGHHEGDELLITICKTVNDSLRLSDTLCRFGGDEFLIILPDCSIENATIIWERIQKNLDTINIVSNKPYKLSLSHGFAEYPEDRKISIDEFITIADNLMYEEKQRYKNQKIQKN